MDGSMPAWRERGALAQQVARLPDTARLLSSGSFDVYCVERSELGPVMGEIGRLRAIAYRAAGEGTGSECDLDAFDDHYLHLFAWNRERGEVVGAYRIGRADRIVEHQGIDGLYTRTLFRYDRSLFEGRAPALELGRSFVRLEYQRHHTALLLLWRGICQYVSRHAQYRVLYGAVSISARYSEMTRRLLIDFLEQNHRHKDARLVAAMHPPHRSTRSPLACAATVESLDALIARHEADGKRMPVLLRQYLKLNARLLAFSVDPAFGDALDALMMVDLREVDVSILRRYSEPRAERHLTTTSSLAAYPAA